MGKTHQNHLADFFTVYMDLLFWSWYVVRAVQATKSPQVSQCLFPANTLQNIDGFHSPPRLNPNSLERNIGSSELNP